MAPGDLAGMGQRVGSLLVDGILQAIPYAGALVVIANWIMGRRGHTIGLKIAGARIVRRNGDLSGFFHTSVRTWAAVLSAIPLGLGFWWAFWDPWRQTWHDKIMGTYVLRNTEELAHRPGSSSRSAVAWFWILLVVPFLLGLILVSTVALPNLGGFLEAGAQLSYDGDRATLQTAVDAFRADRANIGGIYPTVGALSAADGDGCLNGNGTTSRFETLGANCEAYVALDALVAGGAAPSVQLTRLDNMAGGFLATTSAIMSASPNNLATGTLGSYDWYVDSNGRVQSDPTWESAKTYP